MRSNAVVLESRHEPRWLISLADSKEYPLSKLKGKKVLAVSGIANPQPFENSLSAYGADIVFRHRLGDHQGRPRDVWKWIAAHRKDGAWPVMTEKDAVRWVTEDVPRELLTHAYALRMELVLSSGLEIWQKMIKRLAARSANG